MSGKKFHIVFWVLITSYQTFGQLYIASSTTVKVQPTALIFSTMDVENNGTLDTDGDVYYLHDFINNGNMATTNGRSFFNSPTVIRQNIRGTSGNARFYNLTINVTAAGAEGVFVDNDMGVFVTREINLQAGDLRLAGESQLIQSHSGLGLVNGSGSILIDQQGTGDIFDFNYWSLPVRTASGNYNLTANLYDGTNSASNPFQKLPINFVSGFNGAPGLPIAISKYWLFKFINRADSDPNGFQTVTPADNLAPGEGFTMKGSGAGATQNYVLSGLPNDGDYNHSVSPNNFSIIGNPYPSALDANSFIADNTATLAPGSGLFFWDHFGGGTHVQREYQGGYAVYTLAGGTPALAHPQVDQSIAVGIRTPGRFIPVGQAFFVQAASSGGTFTFTNSQRSFFRESDIGSPPDNNTSVFMKANSPKTRNINLNLNRNQNAVVSGEVIGKIRLGHEDTNGFHRQLLLDFNPKTTSGIDVGWDASMLDVFKDDIYWIADGEKLVIQSLPFQAGEQIPLGVVSDTDSYRKFMIDDIVGINQPVFLFDAQNEISYELKKEPTTVWIEKGVHEGRFFISFLQNTLSQDDPTVLGIDLQVFYHPETATIQLESSLKTLGQIEVFAISGQRMYMVKDLNNTSTSIAVGTFSTGVYLVKVRFTDGGIKTKKVVKY